MLARESSKAGITCLKVRVRVGCQASEVALIVSVRKAGSITILELTGALKLGESEQMFRQQALTLVEEGVRHMAINLAGVPEMDSSGIGSIVRVYTQLKKCGGRCTFFAPTKRVSQLIQMVRLDSVLDIVEDEAAALIRN
jgi:anti-sigma B factor antagonist